MADVVAEVDGAEAATEAVPTMTPAAAIRLPLQLELDVRC